MVPLRRQPNRAACQNRQHSSMNWKMKAAIQRTCAALPAGQESVYYLLQRTFGSLRRPPDPRFLLQESARLTARLGEAGVPINGARVMEVGTGRRLDMPLGLYLCGAASVITFDLHPYLKPRLVMQTIDAIRERKEEVRGYFAPVCEAAALDSRLSALCAVSTFDELRRVTGIEYRAPADAAATGLPAHSIDIQISYTVFEHIPGPILKAILVEANRILTPGGVALHHIDPSDHFWHEDASLSPIHFLQFSEKQWKHYGDNQFAYHNRLRATEFRSIYEESRHEILQWLPHVDQRCLALLENGFPLDSSFRGMDRENLCTTVLHVLSRPMRG